MYEVGVRALNGAVYEKGWGGGGALTGAAMK